MWTPSPFRDDRVAAHFAKNNMVRVYTPFNWLIQAPSWTSYRINLLYESAEGVIQEFKQMLNSEFKEKSPHVFRIEAFPELIWISSVCEDHLTPNQYLKEVIVDVNSGSSVLRGSHIYVPGVIAIDRKTTIGEKVQVFIDMSGKCLRGQKGLIDSKRKYFIGVGMLTMWPKHVFAQNSSGMAVKMINTISKVPALGDLSIPNRRLLQNIPSVVTVRVLDPKPGEIILDMCAAPGKKTTHISELMKNDGILVALDRNKQKMRKFQKFITDYNLQHIKPYVYDSMLAFSYELQENNQDWLPPYKANTFDRVLVDAPCSGLGKRPLLAQNINMKLLKSFSVIQKKLLFAAVNVLKIGGILVYSTCTINEKENEHMVAWVMHMFPQMRLLDASPRLGSPGWASQFLPESESQLCQRFDSSSSVDTIGFFIAKFQKTDDSNSNFQSKLASDMGKLEITESSSAEKPKMVEELEL